MGSADVDAWRSWWAPPTSTVWRSPGRWGAGVQPGAAEALADATSADAAIEGSGDTGAAASPERVTSSTRTHAPRTAAHKGRR